MLLRKQIEGLGRGLKISMLSRLLTALTLISVILVVLYLQIAWLFSSLILLVCIIAFNEWIKNKFNNIAFGFILIFNFGFWSIFFILLGESYANFDETTLYILYGLIILNTGIFDTFAFIVGSKCGKTFIVKKISPNKTLEGLIAGLLASLLIGIIFCYIVKVSFWFIIYFVLGGLCAFVGDLLISYFKRQSGIKDTGTILPGHGGILDRIDSHLLATPILIILGLFL